MEKRELAINCLQKAVQKGGHGGDEFIKQWEEQIYKNAFRPAVPPRCVLLTDNTKWNVYNCEIRNLAANLKRGKIEVALITEDLPSFLVQQKASSLTFTKQFRSWDADDDDSSNEVAESKSFKCEHCGSRRITTAEMQTRSADEPMTIYFTCTTCNKRWKI